MNDRHIAQITQELKLPATSVLATAKLLEEGATVPFIARYRKEATGMLDEVAITNIRDRLAQLAELDARRDAILKSLEERKLLTDALKAAVEAATTMTALEDIYQPYRPKKRTRAMIAREAGLEPLADLLFAQSAALDPSAEAAAFISQEKGVADAEAALSGARDIIAERISDDKEAREHIRKLYTTTGIAKSKVLAGKEAEAAKFKDYFEWSEPISSAPSHRVLAMRRGEKEGFLTMRITAPEEDAVAALDTLFVKENGKPGSNAAAAQVKLAIRDGYTRLLGPAMETEMRLESKKRADTEAIRVFADNLRELLLASPLGQRNTLAIDPGFRTGCKLVALDRQGKLLHNDVVYPDQGERRREEAEKKVRAFVEHFKIEAIAIGNGTASRETDSFIRSLKLPPSIAIVMVNESGASIYSASDVAREEFPDHDITVRGAVSIGRRLMDPLAELVKLDPKSIGVGQYQHDVDQNQLKQSLDDVVMSCVNGVGVELNTASKQLLTYVSGLGPSLAENIVAYRNEKGAFATRDELKKVPRLGPKAFQQAAGFLRIRDAKHPLDASAVHPEAYPIVDAMARDLNCTVADLIKSADLRKKIQLDKYVTAEAGLPTLRDIMAELAKPGRDPRQQFELFQFAEGVHKVEDLKPGMKLPGIVTNVTAFGAFVDIGVHQDGLVHISQISDTYVKNPADVLKVQDKVQVTVLEVDIPRQRISLSLKSKPELGYQRGGERPERGVSSGGGGGAAGKGSFSRSGGAGGSAPRGSDRPAERRPQQQTSLAGDWFSEAMKKAKK
ncbi:RNA-binding transcriptional accessory protein [Verrucomicrobia bacterium LW23]|nr:RNA-binding transcriptional accessory protein [Verrucomicrobia bacterium LW23]